MNRTYRENAEALACGEGRNDLALLSQAYPRPGLWLTERRTIV
jgi:hypothetical protein